MANNQDQFEKKDVGGKMNRDENVGMNKGVKPDIKQSQGAADKTQPGKFSEESGRQQSYVDRNKNLDLDEEED